MVNVPTPMALITDEFDRNLSGARHGARLPAMSADPLQPATPKLGHEVEINPSDEDIMRTLVEIENSSGDNANQARPDAAEAIPPIARSQAPAIAALAVLGIAMLVLGLRAGRSPHSYREATASNSPRSVDPEVQSQAENLRQALASGDLAAASQVKEEASTRIGKTRVTSNTDQLITTAINRHDLAVRQAALEAQLALNAITRQRAGPKHTDECRGGSQSPRLGFVAIRGTGQPRRRPSAHGQDS